MNIFIYAEVVKNMNDYGDMTHISQGYLLGINRAINKLVELGKIDATEATELSMVCIMPDSYKMEEMENWLKTYENFSKKRD